MSSAQCVAARLPSAGRVNVPRVSLRRQTAKFSVAAIFHSISDAAFVLDGKDDAGYSPRAAASAASKYPDTAMPNGTWLGATFSIVARVGQALHSAYQRYHHLVLKQHRGST